MACPLAIHGRQVSGGVGGQARTVCTGVVISTGLNIFSNQKLCQHWVEDIPQSASSIPTAEVSSIQRVDALHYGKNSALIQRPGCSLPRPPTLTVSLMPLDFHQCFRQAFWSCSIAHLLKERVVPKFLGCYKRISENNQHMLGQYHADSDYEELHIGVCEIVALVVMAMKLRGQDEMDGLYTRIETKHITATSKMVADYSGMQVQPHKAIVGAHAFAHESGIHQDGMLKYKGTYEFISPEDIGLHRTNLGLVLGKHSGRHALKTTLMQLGHDVEGEALDEIFMQFKAILDKQKKISHAELETLVAIGLQRQTQGCQMAVSNSS